MFSKQRSFQDSLFYDISAWTFPYAFNLDHHFENTTELASGEVTAITPPKGGVEKKRKLRLSF